MWRLRICYVVVAILHLIAAANAFVSPSISTTRFQSPFLPERFGRPQERRTFDYLGKTKSSLSPYKKQSHRLGLSFSSVASSIRTATTSDTTNWLLVSASAALLAGYHLWLGQQERRGKATWRKVQADTREDWSKFVRDSEGWLYAVQTLRNAITANTFLATTVLSLLTLISGKLWDLVKSLEGSRVAQRRLVLQFASIALCMLKSAYEFLQSARLATHAGFMYPIFRQGTETDQILRKSHLSQWLGLRWLYVSLSTIMWTIGGDRGLAFSSIALVRFFHQIDRAPSEVPTATDS